MKWLLTRINEEVNIYPNKDILPHQLDPNCPCTPRIIYLHDKDVVELELDDFIEPIVAEGETTIIMHTFSIEKLKDPTN